MHCKDSFKSGASWWGAKLVEKGKNLLNISHGTPHEKYMASSKTAFFHMMPTWKGFCFDVDSTCETAMEAVERVNQTMQCMQDQFLATTFTQHDNKAKRKA